MWLVDVVRSMDGMDWIVHVGAGEVGREGGRGVVVSVAAAVAAAVVVDDAASRDVLFGRKTATPEPYVYSGNLSRTSCGTVSRLIPKASRSTSPSTTRRLKSLRRRICT